MPTYTTVPNVLSLYPRVGSLASVNSASIAFYIDQAENEINGYLANNYTLPFSSSPPLVTTLSTEYSLVKILERFFTQEVGSKNEWVEERKKYLLDTFNKINNGDIGLVTSSGELIVYNSGDTIFSNTMTYNPTFTMLDETLQQIDSDRLEDEHDAVRDEEYNPFY
jgi:phage gp36-like protein|tara:strand:+ start:228 stop:725 length:498 start_codon:yes stop_codon:yes gene_type:complete